MGTNANWNKAIPSATSRVADGDDAIRSFKSHMQNWWETEHYGTDGSTTSAGVHKLGSARAWQAAASAMSNPTGDNSGRLFHNQTTGQMMVANGSTSSFSATAPEYASVTSTTGAAFGCASGAQTVATLIQTQAFWTYGDFLVASIDSYDPAGSSNIFMQASLSPSAESSVVVYFHNENASRWTAPAGTVIRVLGFKR